MSVRPSMLNTKELLRAVAGDEFWEPYLVSASLSRGVRLHLAVMVEPYLTYVLEGSKTVESRFARTAVAPYRRVSPGDILCLKHSGGGLGALCVAGDTWFYKLTPQSWREIQVRFGSAMRVSERFLKSRSTAVYATLIQLRQVTQIESVSINKHDRRGWVVMYDPANSLESTSPEGASQLRLGL